jgi:hypothetical protein
VNYESIDARGLHITFGEKREKPECIEVDTIVLCAGQEPLRELVEPLRAGGIEPHLIGGADVAAELDAKRAIDQEAAWQRDSEALPLPDSLRALRAPNFRRYYVGQAVSMIGTWMQSVAVMWLAYRLSGSTVFTGLVGFLMGVPYLVVSPSPGVLGDRVNRRKLLIAALALMGLQSAILAVLTGLNLVTLPILAALVLCAGICNGRGDAHPPVDLRTDAGAARGPAERDRAELDADERHAPW